MMDKYALIKVMREVFSNPMKKYSIRGLAKITKLSVNASKYSLDYMLLNDLVTLEKLGRTYQFRSNFDNYLLKAWKILFSVEEIHEAKIVENIINTKKSIISIILYGSTAIGNDDENSDIDILVIADSDTDGKKAIITCAKGTKREPNITVYTPQEWRKKAEVDKIFYENVIMNSIVLYGQKPVIL